MPAIQQRAGELCDEFDILIDRDRRIYHAYGLERSFLRSHSFKTMWLYARRIVSGQPRYDSHGDDSSQLGGDFIVDSNGTLRLIHPSSEPVDRPPVEMLLTVLRALPSK